MRATRAERHARRVLEAPASADLRRATTMAKTAEATVPKRKGPMASSPHWR